MTHFWHATTILYLQFLLKFTSEETIKQAKILTWYKSADNLALLVARESS